MLRLDVTLFCLSNNVTDETDANYLYYKTIEEESSTCESL